MGTPADPIIPAKTLAEVIDNLAPPKEVEPLTNSVDSHLRSDVEKAIEKVLKEQTYGEGYWFMTSYQLFQCFPEDLRIRLITRYSEGGANNAGGARYSSRTFVSQVACSMEHVEREYFSTIGTSFDVIPGNRDVCAIYRWKK